MDSIGTVSSSRLAVMIRCRPDKALIIDSRTFCEYNTSRILNSVNVWSSKLRKKRLQQDSISVHDYLQQACLVRVTGSPDILVYDQNAPDVSAVPQDSFLHVLLTKLGQAFINVSLLAGGFLEFQAAFPELCEDCSQKCTPLTSLSQPCLPVSNVGPTRILPFLYLGSQHDANNRQLLQDHNIVYEVNVSTSCPKPDFLQESHFLRIPVNDNFSEKLLPYFADAFRFIDKVREGGGCVLVHCLAGISRSPTVAIAYVMKHLRLPYDEAYRYVKHRRPTISPNINFVGQLLELDKQLRHDGTLTSPLSTPGSTPSLFRGAQEYTSSFSVLNSASMSSSISSSNSNFSSKRMETHTSQLSRNSGMPRSLSLNLRTTLEAVPASPGSTPQSPPDLSPSSALAKLSFTSPLADEGYSIFSGQGKLPSTPVTPPSSSPVFFTHQPTRPILPSSCTEPLTPCTALIRSPTSPVFNFKKSFTSNTSSESYSSYFNKDSVYTSDSRNDNNKRISSECTQENTSTENSSIQSNNYFTTASISLSRDDNNPTKRRSSESEGRKLSVCVIEVNHEPSPVSYVKSRGTEPMIIRETEVYAVPCSEKESKHMDEETNKESDKDQTKIEKCKREIIVPIRVTNKNFSEERPNALQLSVPDYSQPLKPKNIPIKTSGGEVIRPLGSPLEAATAGNTIAAMPISPANNPQTISTSNSDSIINNNSQRLPRCYSSSETHLNTRRLLENRAIAGNDYATRKSSSTDEMGRGWTQHPPPPIHTQPPNQVVAKDGTILACPGELARCDSWSTSGLGSEISDWESLQDDSHSVHNEDALGPFDAVFSDVFPGGDPNDIPIGQQIEHYKNQQRHSSYKEHPLPGTPRTPRPASLPGVMGTYLSHFDSNTNLNSDLGVEVEDGVELRPSNGKGRAAVSRNDSGFYSFPGVEHPAVSPRTMGEGVRHTSNPLHMKDRPKDLQLQSFYSTLNLQSSEQTTPPPKLSQPFSQAARIEFAKMLKPNMNTETSESLRLNTSKSNNNNDSKPPLGNERKLRSSQDKTVISRLSNVDICNNKTMVDKHAPYKSYVIDAKKCAKSPDRHVTLFEFPITTIGEKCIRSSDSMTHEKRIVSEKRKIRGNSQEETEEKRRSCEAETDSSNIWKTSRQPLALGAGSQLNDDLVHMENVLDSEISEIRRRTAAITRQLQQITPSESAHKDTTPPSATSRSRSPNSSGRSSRMSRSPGRDGQLHKSQVYLNMVDRDSVCSDPNKENISSNTYCMKSCQKPQDEINITLSNIRDSRLKTYYCGGPTGQTITVEHWDGSGHHLLTVEQRSQSEPPFVTDEGLYRARSYPGLPRPGINNEGQETVGDLVTDLQMVKLRGPKPVSNKNKIFNRYSCGALDFHRPNPTENSFDSCPDFGSLRPCSRGGDSLQSSNSSLSSHSSFTRLLQVS